jgi:hypothetical protein
MNVPILIRVRICQCMCMPVPMVISQSRIYRYLSLELFICRARQQLNLASVILSSMGLLLSPPSTLLLRTEGDFQAKARFYRITLTTSPSFVQHLALYPQSFSTLDDFELEEKPPHRFTSSWCKSIHVPSRPAVYASIIRLLLSYPKNCATTKVLRSNLSELIGYDLLGLEDGYLDTNDDEAVVAIGLEQRLADATQAVLQWGTDCVWRSGEEWIGDALDTVVAGTGSIEYLPCKS